MGYKYNMAVEISHARKNVAPNNFSGPLHCSSFDPLLVAVIRTLVGRLALTLR
jgi:hypothetical protein